MLGWLSHLLFPASTVLGSPPWVGSRSSPRVACDGPIRMCHQEGAAGGAQPQRAKRCPSCSALGGLHHAGSCSPCPRISCIHNPHPLQPRCMKRASKVINGYQHVSCASQTFSSGVVLQGSLLAFQTASFLPVSWQKKSFAAHSPKLHLTWNTRTSPPPPPPLSESRQLPHLIIHSCFKKLLVGKHVYFPHMFCVSQMQLPAWSAPSNTLPFH